MAFIDFQIDAADRLFQALEVPATTSTEVGEHLSALEKRIVALAQGDGLETLRQPRARSWLARLVFGPAPPSKVLANERLEALRRLAVQAWHHGYMLPVSAVHEARRAGHSEGAVGAVIDMVVRSRPPVRRVTA